MTTFTVFDTADYSTVYGRGLTAVQAMREILAHDGYRWEIRREDGEWRLYHSDGSANSARGARRMNRTVVFSMADDQTVAQNEIADQVIAAGWPRLPDAMTDCDFDLMMTEIAAAEADLA